MPFTDSTQAETVLPLVGVWLHDGDAPEASIRQFMYGSANKADDLDAMGTGTYYSGRTHPVFDFGEHEAEAVAVSLDVPHGPSYRTDLAVLREFARSKKAVWYRDNRGRVYFGPVSGFRTTDTAWGSTVTFTIQQADRPITTTTATLTTAGDGGETPEA